MTGKTEQLRRRYPTMEKYNIAIAAAGTKKALGDLLGMSRQTINLHLIWLRNRFREKRVAPSTMVCRKTNAELDAKINNIYHDNSKDKIMVYRLTDAYIPGSLGTEGLEYLRTDTAVKTIVSAWGEM